MEKEEIIRLLGTVRGKRIAVVGDYVLDEYMVGETGRVSREAPVVVIDYKESIFHPGGAANAARNVTSLGGVALPVGVVGDDEGGKKLLELLGAGGVDTSGLIPQRDLATPVKLRIIAGDLHAQKQQVARVDRLFKLGPGHSAIEEVRERLRRVAADVDGVLISDYGLGLVPGRVGDSVIASAKDAGIPVVVDSRSDLLRFKGASAATPNEVEALEALGVRGDSYEISEVARRIVKEAAIQSLIVTRGKKGMFVLREDGTEATLGIVGTDQVTDVTGAGDTVAAAVAVVLAAGGTIMEGAKLATCAAAVVVTKRGTADVTPQEIEELLAGRDRERGHEGR